MAFDKEMLTCVVDSPDGVKYTVTLGGPYPHSAEERTRTLYLAPDKCEGCGCPPPAEVTINATNASALFVPIQGYGIARQIAAFRSRVQRPNMEDFDEKIALAGFRLEGMLRVVLGDITEETLFALAMLMQPENAFRDGDFPSPLTGVRQRKDTLFSSTVRLWVSPRELKSGHELSREKRGVRETFFRQLPMIVSSRT